MINESNTVILDGGSVAYSVEDGAVSIDDLIEALEDAKSEGAEYVTMTSGTRWSALSTEYYWPES